MEGFKINLFCILLMQYHLSVGGSIVLDQRDADVWHIQQKFSGRLLDVNLMEVVVHHNGHKRTVPTANGLFNFTLKMQPGYNVIWVGSINLSPQIISQKITYRLGYKPTPVVKPVVNIKGNTLILRAKVLENPYNKKLSFYWTAHHGNPARAEISSPRDSITSAIIPPNDGKFYFDLFAISDGDSVKFATYCQRNNDLLTGFSIDANYRTWIDDAVIYEITPYKFVENGKFVDIIAKLPELRSLGINTLWLQPVSQSSQRGQGYDVVDYHAVIHSWGPKKSCGRLSPGLKRSACM